MKSPRLNELAQAFGAALWFGAFSANCLAAGDQAHPPPIVVAKNPDPARVPTLSFWQEESLSRNQKLPMVAAEFPNVPGFTCDSWCYESEVDFVDARPLNGGRLELRHRVKAQPHVLLVTTVTPEPGSVEIFARAEVDKENY